MNNRYKRNFQGFTLVELLVVITIISILAGLSTAAVIYGRVMVINMMTRSQMSQLEIALEQYKNEYGEYPPSLADETAVERHVSARWRRANINYNDVLAAAFNLYAKDDDGNYVLNDGKRTLDTDAIGQLNVSTKHAMSLTFWLGGLFRNDEFIGFCADVSDPFDMTGTKKQYESPMIELDPVDTKKNTRLFDVAGFPVPLFVVRDLPVVYFRSNSAGSYAVKNSAGNLSPQYCNFGTFGVAVPYAKTGDTSQLSGNGPWSENDWNAANIVWFAPKKYQLIYPGMDETFGGRDSSTPAGCLSVFAGEQGIGRDDYDNIASFIDTLTLRGALE